MDAGEIQRARWYHTIDLPDGTATPGEYDLRPIVDRLPWPESMAGMRCLDVGSRDGFYAFHMERHGAAEVVSLDIDDADLLPCPHPSPGRELVQGELDDGNRAFELAREALGSEVVRSHRSVYDLSEAEPGRFDFAVVGTLLHHLRDPVRALSVVRHLLDGPLLVNDAVIPGLDSLRRRPVAELLAIPGPFWSLPNPPGLRRLVESAGFEVAASGSPYFVPYGAGAARPSVRDCVHRPYSEVPRRLLLRRGSPHAWVSAVPA